MRVETKAYSSYGSVSTDDSSPDEAPFEPPPDEKNRLIRFKEKHISMEDSHVAFPRRSLGKILACGVSGFVVLILLLYGAWKWENDHGILPDGDHDYPEDPPFRKERAPFSTLDPVADLGLNTFHRPHWSSVPPPLSAINATNYPTNAWYQNLLMAWEEPELIHNAYSIPYIVDCSGPFPGLRIHPTHVGASSSVVQLDIVEQYAVILGVSDEAMEHTRTYQVTHTTPLGVTLDWNAFPMHSTITKGMPYGTMVYKRIRQVRRQGHVLLPTIGSQVPLAVEPLVDSATRVKCNTKPFLVKREVELLFDQSDFSWLVFVSEPVVMTCQNSNEKGLRLQIAEWQHEKSIDRDLVVRVALSKLCSTGISPIYCHQELIHPTALNLGQGHYSSLLRKFADLFPGPETTFDYVFSDNETAATMTFDWNAQNMSSIALHPSYQNNTGQGVLGFALPHHFDLISEHPPEDHDIYCVSTLIGPSCLYEGLTWSLVQEIPPIGFRAERPPAPWSIELLGRSLQNDIKFRLPDFYQRGAGDTYFSGKMLAKLARILLIYEELEDLCFSTDRPVQYENPCLNLSLPPKTMFDEALGSLRSSVEIWVNGTAETPFVFDPTWGGVVSCGCLFDDKHGVCKNAFPECPAFFDPGLNFGNAFYNDCHFHYGYLIYGAAVVSHFDHEWGRSMYERVLLLIRTIANPSNEESHFTKWRHKDWFSSHSWASGIAATFQNGRNQESSSEAIAAYEAIALFGTTMRLIFGNNHEGARSIGQAGKLLTATELRGAQFYWHPEIRQEMKIYPSAYTPHTVGMLWNIMAQAQTWFGSQPYLAYGIQLLPLTPVAEHRDTQTWAKSMYQEFAPSCSADPACEENGWSILQLAMLATVGHPRLAADLVAALPAEVVFESAGGNGHSETNTIWYCASRPSVDIAVGLQGGDSTSSSQPVAVRKKVVDCGNPSHCTDFVLDTIAGLYSCRQRMEWLMLEYGKTETEACTQVSSMENPRECGHCDPQGQASNTTSTPSTCRPCTSEECNSDYLNRCPKFEATYVCTKGPSTGGCSSDPWIVPSMQCADCCELSNCSDVKPPPVDDRGGGKRCPTCTEHVCNTEAKLCPSHHAVQFLCTRGPSRGGCSLSPWFLNTGQCTECCSVPSSCADNP